MGNPRVIRCAVLALLAATIASVPAGAQNWTQCNIQKPGPPARYFHAMAYDAARQKTVLFGGFDLYGIYLAGDTWEWDGSTWTQRRPAVSPTARANHAMVYDAGRQRVVLFGGSGGCSDTWEWDGKTWTQCYPATVPPARYEHAMAYDSSRRRVVLYGGASPSANDTWEWDGNNWTQRWPSTIPPAASSHAMAYDVSRQRVVMFGGMYGLVFHWEWDGSNWNPNSSASNPPTRFGHGMVYDMSRQRTVLFGGNVNTLWQNDTWEWDGSTWTQRWPVTSPSVRANHAMAYDSARQRVVLFGGEDLWGAVADTWEYGLDATIGLKGVARPGSTVTLVLTAANDAGLPYQAGSSLGTGPMRLADGRRIDLGPDSLLVVSVAGLWPWVFSGYRGILDSRGQATASIRVPASPALVGTRIHTAFVTLNPTARCGIKSISKAVLFTISP
jgi:hypothetical protein